MQIRGRIEKSILTNRLQSADGQAYHRPKLIHKTVNHQPSYFVNANTGEAHIQIIGRHRFPPKSTFPFTTSTKIYIFFYRHHKCQFLYFGNPLVFIFKNSFYRHSPSILQWLNVLIDKVQTDVYCKIRSVGKQKTQ